MLRNLLAILFTFSCLSTIGQTYTHCRMYQFHGTDSLNKHLGSEMFYNSKGQDSLYCHESGKTIYSYNEKSQQIKVEWFGITKKVRPGNVRRPKGCTLKSGKAWKKLGERTFLYDERGNNIVTNHTRVYDDKNRLLIDSVMDESGRFVSSIWNYTYYENGYQRVETWYDEDGKQMHLDKKYNKDLRPQTIYTYKQNAAGQVTEEKKMTSEGRVYSREAMFYYPSGMKAMHIHYLRERPYLTTVYEYD